MNKKLLYEHLTGLRLRLVKRPRRMNGPRVYLQLQLEGEVLHEAHLFDENHGWGDEPTVIDWKGDVEETA